MNQIKELLTKIEDEASPLLKVIYLAKLAREVTAEKQSHVAEANKLYIEQTKTNLGAVKIENLAILSSNSAQGFWVYPAAINTQESGLKAAKIEAQKNKEAVKQSGAPLNPEMEFIFKIQLI